MQLSAAERLGVVPAMLLVLLILAVVIFNLVVIIVDPGEVCVPVRLGAVRGDVLKEGFHIVDPFTACPRLSVRRNILEMSSGGSAEHATGGNELVALSADQLPMAVDIGFPYALNPDSAIQVFQHIGDDVAIQQLIRPAARSAVRDAVARFNWEDAAARRREELSVVIDDRFRHLVKADLRGLGFTAAEAENAFSLPPAQLRRIVPPQSVQDAVAERMRTQQDLQRQEALNEIARIEAERRASEGLGLAKLFAALPKGFEPHQVAIILNAMANKTRADAMLQAAQSQHVQTIIMDGGPIPIQVNAAPAK